MNTNKTQIVTNYPDGFYLVTNRYGAKTTVIVQNGLVYIADGGLGDGRTGHTLDYYDQTCQIRSLEGDHDEQH